ncbi:MULTISPECIES: YqgQ family protein [Virgibacillus]|uniref:Cytosolic protein n=1 Tax=Virgibacillus pantothenticus TaxID=1473 RepID=A0A0L0QPD9_VIRPA|nr:MULTISPECIES: YqgQ family protein [Virgibacillus]API90538.1 hypothetical protein BKP57_00870 [Virgibacillus sp. 6R]KNE20495.1 hypothetical protein AFK71_19195 [Virgibacillus pantothenticus]MBS7429648.1 YqgQ family protein [Virgibacillus sp. 19R1-5]MBU8565523.1 YqgQ family protein [Virgibacillus pantothenticus]MBU8599823.1 YqgQ family protein [Virgibacillus pantothenticus]
MKSIYEIQQFLRKYGTFIYTGSRLGDLQMMELEINELYQLGFIENKLFMEAKLLLKKEMTSVQKQKKGSL